MSRRRVALVLSVGAVVLASASMPAAVSADGVQGDGLSDVYGTVLQISSMDEFMAHAGDADTALVVAAESTDPGGKYTFTACADGVDERLDPSCGMVALGPGTGVFGEGRNEVIGGVPSGAVVTNGPSFDCGALALEPDDWGPNDFNGWDLACFEISGGNTISGVQIDNGPDATPHNPGEGFHRNGVLVQPGAGEALVEHSVLTDVRRGILVAAGDSKTTSFTADSNIVRRTELTGLFVLASAVPPASVDDAILDVSLVSNYLEDTGRIGILYAWGVGGDSNTSSGRLIDNVVIGSVIGVGVFAEGFLTPEPIVANEATIEIRGGTIDSSTFGVSLFMFDDGPQPDNIENTLTVEMTDVHIVGSFTPVYVEYDEWGEANEYRLDMRRNRYTSQDGSPGSVDVCAFSFDTFDCQPPEADPPFRFTASRNSLESQNENLDFAINAVFFAEQDSDGDGVEDGADACPATEVPEPEPDGWKPNRYIADASGNFVDPQGREAGVTVGDTGGCAGSQIIEHAGLGKGHSRRGITKSALLDWVASLS